MKSHTVEGERLDDLLREAEVVTEFLYGNKNRAAAQALYMHNKYNGVSPREEVVVDKPPLNHVYSVHVVST